MAVRSQAELRGIGVRFGATLRRRAHDQRGTLAMLAVMFALVMMANSNQLHVLTTIMIVAILAMSVNVVLGLAGQISFGQALFYGIGAYATAIATQNEASWLVGAIAGVLIAVVVGLLIGWAALRLHGHYLAMFTFAAGMAFYLIVRNLELTGGINGKAVLSQHTNLLGMSVSPGFGLAMLCLVVLGIATAAFAVHRTSRFGRLLIAVREDETLLVTSGISVAGLKLRAFVLGAFWAAVAGVLFGLNTMYVEPESFHFMTSIDAVVMAVLGGLGSTLGPWLGGSAFVGVDHLMTSWEHLRLIVFGALTIIVLLGFPKGLEHAVRAGFGLLTRSLGSGDQQEEPAAAEGAVSASTDASPALPSVSVGPAPTDRNGSNDLLVVDAITKSYGGVVALRDVSFRAGPGELVACVGPNGAGKTTLFNCLTGWSKPDGGSVHFDAEPLTGAAPLTVARRGIARSFQTPRVVDDLSVLDNLRLGQLNERHVDDGPASEMARALGLGQRVGTDASHLTHGERKRVELGRALLQRPRLILLDEPFAGLSANEIELCSRLMQAFAESGGVIVFIDHNLRSVMSLATRVVVLDFGAVIADDMPEKVTRLPEVEAAYQMTTGQPWAKEGQHA